MTQKFDINYVKDAWKALYFHEKKFDRNLI